MIGTVVVAALGLGSTLLAAWLTSRSHRRGEREGRILDAKVRIYGECASSLYEYERATYNRVKARLASVPHDVREDMRQQAYEFNSRARAAIGQVAILCDEQLRDRLEEARSAVGEYNRAVSEADPACAAEICPLRARRRTQSCSRRLGDLSQKCRCLAQSGRRPPV